MKKNKFYILALVASVCLFVQSCGNKETAKDASTTKESTKGESVETQHNHDHNHDHEHNHDHDHAH